MDGSLPLNTNMRGKAPPISDADVEFIRTASQSMQDAEVGKLLGWSDRRVRNVRKKHGIPACVREDGWPQARVAELRRLYLVEGVRADVVAEKLGVTTQALVAKMKRLGWKRPRIHRDANLSAVNAAKRPPKPVSPLRAAPVHNLAKAPVIFKGTPAFQEPLDTRILREIGARPLTAQTIATVLGEKELTVSMQLSALRHAGQVEADGEGRNKRWKAALCGLQEYTNRSESMGCGGAVTPAAS